jgi:hypothetical protein
LLRNGLHNPIVPPLLGADDIELTASSIVACWTVLTELLPGNALIKSVIVVCWTVLTELLPGNALIKSVTILHDDVADHAAADDDECTLIAFLTFASLTI